MAQLAIKGHPTRGEEVIEILEMLGGNNLHTYGAYTDSLCFYINKNTNIIYYVWVNNCHKDILVFTLEELLEKFPYKIGDKVYYDNKVCDVIEMRWIGNLNTISYGVYDGKSKNLAIVEELKPHKEEPMENKGTLVEIDLTREETKAEEIEVILGDYEFVLKEGKTYFVKKKPQYPKTYEECFNICFGNHHPVVQVVGLDGLGNNKSLFERFIKLKICRDAYWKIAGEQMGLGKPWKPTWNGSESCYCIFCDNGEILEDEVSYGNTILAFPVKEIRDAFKENFDDDIEFCKEFL